MDLDSKESEIEESSTQYSTSKVASTTVSNIKSKVRDDAAQEASERRRIWTMAAASAAEMIKELTQKAPPQFDDVTKVFAPITPGEWAEKRLALDALRGEIDDTEEISDAQVAEELFYDPDATDDDLGMFLGASDKELKELYRGSSGQIFATKGQKKSWNAGGARPSSGAGPKPIPTEKSTEAVRRKSSSEDGEADKRRPSQVSNLSQEPSDKDISGRDPESLHSQQAAESSKDISQHDQRKSSSKDEEGTPVIDVNKRTSQGAQQTSQSNSSDDFYYVYEESVEQSTTNIEDEAVDESDGELYFPADVNINVDEALVGLENLLDDFKLESRITDRFKCKLINKYSLLLQAFITYQERETETITHLQTKRKILNALHQFVQTEAEAAAKAVVAEEEKDEDKEEGQALDLVGKHEEGGEKGDDGQKPKENQGLSIEEMPAATIRETLLTQKNRLDVLECIKKVHVLQLKQLEFERTLLNLHYSKMVKPSDLSKEIKDGRRQVNDLQLEISSIHQEMGQIQNEIRIQEKHVLEEEKSVEKLELEALTKQGEVQVLANKPIHIAKEADREAQKLEQLQDTHENICRRLMDCMEIYRTNQAKVDVLAAELTSLTKMEIKLAQQKKAAIKDYDTLLGQMDNMMNKEHMMLDRASLLTERMQTLVRTKKRMVEEQHRMFNDARCEQKFT